MLIGSGVDFGIGVLDINKTTLKGLIRKGALIRWRAITHYGNLLFDLPTNACILEYSSKTLNCFLICFG